MTRALWNKYVAEAILLFIGIAIGVFAFSWFRVWVVGELDTAQFRQIIDLLPKNWRKFASVDFDWLVSYLGRTSLTLDEPMLVLLISAWGLVRGSDVVSGELSRGTMEMLLAQPVSRKKVFVQHAITTIFFLSLLVAICWIGMALGIWMTSVEESTYPEIRIPIADYRIPLSFLPPSKETIAMATVVNPLAFLPGVANLFCLGFCMSGFAAFCSSMDRYRWRTLGVVAVFFFANAGAKIVGMGSERLGWVEHIGVFGLYSPAGAIELSQHDPWSVFYLVKYSADGTFEGLGLMGHCGLLLLIGMALYWVGLKNFVQRDLPAPM